jgi:acyl carrier protein
MVNENLDSREDIQVGVVNVLQNMVEEWDLDLAEPIGPDTRIIEDLGFESIDLVQLVVGIEEKFGVRGLPYEEVLMKDGAYVTEIHLSDLVDFLQRHIPNLRSAVTAAE